MTDAHSAGIYTLYGLKSCDTIKKARRYLDSRQINYHFHDYRQEGLADELLQQFIDYFGFDVLLNTRGTTWRKLSPEVRQSTVTAEAKKALMLTYPALIKRPLLCSGQGSMLVGFSEEQYHSFIQETV